MLQPDDDGGEDSILQAWGDVIRRYRQWKRLTRRELAQRARLSRVFLGEIERGQKDPSTHSLSRIAAALDVELGELYLRVALRLGGTAIDVAESQNALPLAARETPGEYLAGVPLVKDETAFDLYKIVRTLRSDQQIALLLLARSLSPSQS